MAKRPVFIAKDSGPRFVEEFFVDFEWHPGLSRAQKQKNVLSLHQSFESARGVDKVLEISTKSNHKLGVKLSAFNLKFDHSSLRHPVSVESIFQGSKKFERGGPYTDLYEKTSLEAKRDPRIKESGDLVAFEFFSETWPLLPKTLFYDWLYIKALSQHTNIMENLLAYEAFTDIEFNPNKSINCQARSAALCVSLKKRGLIERAMSSKLDFQSVMTESEQQETQCISDQMSLFASEKGIEMDSKGIAEPKGVAKAAKLWETIHQEMKAVMRIVNSKAPELLELKEKMRSVEKHLDELKRANITPRDIEDWLEQVNRKASFVEEEFKRNFGSDFERELTEVGLTLKGHYPELKVEMFVVEIDWESKRATIWIGPKQEKIEVCELKPKLIAKKIQEAKSKMGSGMQYDKFFKYLSNAYSDVVGKSKDADAPIVQVLSKMAFLQQSDKFLDDPKKENYQEYSRVDFLRDLFRFSSKLRASGVQLVGSSRAFTKRRSDFIWVPSDERSGTGNTFSHVRMKGTHNDSAG